MDILLFPFLSFYSSYTPNPKTQNPKSPHQQEKLRCFPSFFFVKKISKSKAWEAHKRGSPEASIKNLPVPQLIWPTLLRFS